MNIDDSKYVLDNIMSILTAEIDIEKKVEHVKYWLKMRPTFDKNFYKKFLYYIEENTKFTETHLYIIDCFLENGLDINYLFDNSEFYLPEGWMPINFTAMLFRRTNMNIIEYFLMKRGKINYTQPYLLYVIKYMVGTGCDLAKKILFVCNNQKMLSYTDENIDTHTLEYLKIYEWLDIMNNSYFQNRRNFYIKDYIELYNHMQQNKNNYLYKILILMKDDFIIEFQEITIMRQSNHLKKNISYVKHIMKNSLKKISSLPIPLEAKISARAYTSVGLFYTRAEQSFILNIR